MKHRMLLLVIAGVLGAGGGWLFTEQVLKAGSADQAPATPPQGAAMIGLTRPDFSLGGTTGQLISSADFDGQVLLINFWATWCKPCREEMPMLSGLHTQLAGRGFQVLGVALDDVAQARDFVEELKISYPNAVGGVDVMAMGSAYGNRAGLLPYSVLIDRSGVIRWNSLGELKLEELSDQIEKLL